jgi:hypothetical protein
VQLGFLCLSPSAAIFGKTENSNNAPDTIFFHYFYVYCAVHDEQVINTKFPTYMDNVVLFQHVSA